MIHHSSFKGKVKCGLPLVLTIGLYALFYYCFFAGFYQKADIGSVDQALVVIWNIFAALGAVSLVYCVALDPGCVPDDFCLENIPSENTQSLSDDMREIDHCLGKVTYCNKCGTYRPSRAHHCSYCERCILRYDHHCPYVANCVGLRNHKAFILFLGYSGISLAVMGAQVLSFALQEDTSDWKVLVAGIGGIGLFFTLFGFACFHLWLVVRNCTSLELNWRDFNIYDLGNYQNFTQVFGKSKLYWLLPGPSNQIEGLLFPVKIRNKTGGYTVVENKYLI